MANEPDAMQTALALHQSGQLAAAEVAYRKILGAQPRNAGALHLLGLVAYQSGRAAEGAAAIQQAIAIEPRQTLFYGNLGEILEDLGRADEARACYEQAVRLSPADPVMHFRLGLLLAPKDPETARRHYEAAIRAKPDFVDAHNNLGNVLVKLGHRSEALAAYQAAAKYDPQNKLALVNLGGLLFALNQLDDAASYLERALQIDPNMPTAHFRLGNVQLDRGNLASAVEHLRQAVRLRPNDADAHQQLCKALQLSGDTTEALAAYAAALAIVPDHVPLLIHYGTLLQQCGRIDEARARYERILELDPQCGLAHFALASLIWAHTGDFHAVAGFEAAIRYAPDFADSYLNLAILRMRQGDLDQAIEVCEAGLRVAPDYSPLHATLAACFRLQGRGPETIAASRKALEFDPANAGAHSELLYAMNYYPEFDTQTIYAAHLEWARRHAEPLTQLAAPHANTRAVDRRIRVGYVSPHFHQHAVNFFFEPILQSHDHERFEIVCYSTSHTRDSATQRLEKVADRWRDVAYQSDAQIAEQVRADAIDILVDLTGHIPQNRLLVFARKPAPVQVTYLGYQNTTGMSAMDYRLTDEHADPPGQTDAYYTERLVRLPRAFFCYVPFETPPVAERTRAGNDVVFGSFNTFAKVTPIALRTWMQILARVPGSRLVVLAGPEGHVKRAIHGIAQECGIDPARISLMGRRPRAEYLQAISNVDVALDPFPFVGHTTTCDATWMGVPTVMLQGQTYASRFGGSVLANVGLEHLIVDSPEAYVDTAVTLAADSEQLDSLRRELRGRMEASPIMDRVGFTRHLEDAYRAMWRTWCEGR